jgi:Tfp pilus assembly protein PilO
MGKLPPFVIPVAAVVLVGGLSFAAHKWMIAPKQQTLAQKQQELSSLQQKASQLETVRRQLAQTQQEWEEAQRNLQHIMATRSIPLSLSLPVEAMLTLAYELRHDLGPVLTKWLESTGCEIVSGTSLPAPPGSPPVPPAGGFLPLATNLNITLRGTLAQVEALYRSLSKCPRILTVGGLSLQAEGTSDRVVAQVPLTVYLLVEVPPSMAAAAAAPVPTAAGGMPPGMGGEMGMPGMGPAGAGPAAPGGGPPTPPARPAARGRGGEEEEGGGLGRRRGGLGGGEE